MLLAAVVAPEPAASQTDSLRSRVDRYVVESMERTRVPGVAIAIVRSGRVVHVAGYGRGSDGAPITSRTPMRVASLSKSVTALAVIQLVESGKVELDSPVQRYLPAFRIADPRGDRITVRHLLNQTTGLSDLTFPEMSVAQPATLEGGVARLSVATLVAEPGTDWNYHNPNYQVAARLVEVVSGMPFDQYLHRSIFEPLGMTSTTTVDCTLAAEGVGKGHILAYGAAIAIAEPSYFCTGSGGVSTTAEDWGRWLAFQSGADSTGPGIVSQAGLESMHTPSVESRIYGFGWYRSTPANGIMRYSHTGVMGTFSAYQGIFPSLGSAVSVLQNASSPFADPYGIAEGIVAILAETTPPQASRAGLVAGVILALIAIVALVLGVRGLSRAKTWARNRSGKGAFGTLLRIVPYFAPIALFVGLPSLGEMAMSRDGNWAIAFFSFPALVVALGVSALMSAAVLVVRTWHLATGSVSNRFSTPSSS